MDLLAKYYFIDNPLGQFVIYGITTLFVIALFCLCRSLWRYIKIEKVALYRLNKNAEDIDESIMLSQKRELLLQNISDNTIAAQRVNSICRIVEQKHIANQTELASIVYEKERNSIDILAVSYISRTLILLGLLGTFVGLTTIALKFNTLLFQVDTSNINALISSMYKATADIRTTTEGLITAFASTLWGLIGTVFLALGTFFLDHRQHNFLVQLEDTTAVILLPMLNPPTLVHSIENSSRQLATSAGEIRTTIENLKTSADKTYEGMQKLHDVVKHFETTAKSFGGSAEMISSSQIKINSTFEELGAKVAAADLREQSLFENLGKIISQADKQQSLLEDMFKRLQVGEAVTEKVVRECLNEQQKTLEDMKQVTGANSQVLQGVISKQHELFESMIEKATDQNTELKSLNDNYINVLEQIKNSLSTNGKPIEELLDEQKKILENIRNNLSRQSRRDSKIKLARNTINEASETGHSDNLKPWTRAKRVISKIFLSK